MQIDAFQERHSHGWHGDDEKLKKGQYRSLDDGRRLQDNSKNNSKHSLKIRDER